MASINLHYHVRCREDNLQNSFALLVLLELFLFDAGFIALDPQNCLSSFLVSQEAGMEGAVGIVQKD